MMTNMLSVEGMDPERGKTRDRVIVRTLEDVGDKVRESDSLSCCWGLAMDLFHQDP